MKKSYVKPVLNSSMEGTLEGVYAYGNVMALTHGNGKRNKNQPSKKASKNEGGQCVTHKYYVSVCGFLYWEVSYCDFINWWGPKYYI